MAERMSPPPTASADLTTVAHYMRSDATLDNLILMIKDAFPS